MPELTLDELIAFLLDVRLDINGDASVIFEVGGMNVKLPTDHKGKPFVPYAAKTPGKDYKGSLRLKVK